MEGDYVWGESHRRVVRDLTRECRSAQRLVSQLLGYCFVVTLVAVTLIVTLIWELLQ